MSPRGQTRDTVIWKGTSECGTYKVCRFRFQMSPRAPVIRDAPSDPAMWPRSLSRLPVPCADRAECLCRVGGHCDLPGDGQDDHVM